jgi:signal transduction histidine kinase
MQPLRHLLLDSERWLMQRILFYAKRQDYVKYTSTLLEAWRISIESLTATLVAAIDSSAPLEFCPDEDYRQDVIAAFGVEEGYKHRSRGLTLPMYLSLFKYYRQAYLDRVATGGFPPEDAEAYRYFVDRCFDRIELGVVSAWASTDEQPRLKELQVTNRYLANEKNKYLTIFESLHDPVILLDKEGRVHNMNHIAAALFANAAHPGDLYYGDTITSRCPEWLEDLLGQFTAQAHSGLEVERTVMTHRGPRHYLIKLEQMLDVSEKYMGVVVLLNDLTARRQAEERLQTRSEEISTLYDVTAIVTAPAAVEAVLQRALERVLSTVKGLGGSFRLLNPESGELQLVAGQHGELAASPVEACAALAAAAIAQDAPVVRDEIEAGAPGSDPGDTSPCRYAFAAVPMRAGGRIQGVLSVFRAQGHSFTPAEVSLLATVADGVGLAVENNRRALQRAVTEERERLARELHDSVTQSLYSLTLFGEWTAGLLAEGATEQAQEKLLRIGEISRQALKEMRLMVYELRSPDLERHGLRGALEKRLTAVEERAGVRTFLHYDRSVHFPPDVEDELYQIAQEALNNALKHAGASEVTVEVAAGGGRAWLSICDDGGGFDPFAAARSGGMGLASMHTRAARAGGRLHIAAAPGRGCQVRVEMAAT